MLLCYLKCNSRTPNSQSTTLSHIIANVGDPICTTIYKLPSVDYYVSIVYTSRSHLSQEGNLIHVLSPLV